MPSPGWKRKLCPKKWMDKFLIFFFFFFLKILIWSPSLEKWSLLVSFYVENEKFFFSEKASGWGGSCRTESFIPYHSSSELAFGSLRVEGNIVFELFWSFPEKRGPKWDPIWKKGSQIGPKDPLGDPMNKRAVEKTIVKTCWVQNPKKSTFL